MQKGTAKQKIIIVGKGAFGALMPKFLRPYFTVSFIRRTDTPEQIEKKLHSCAVVIYSVPTIGLEQSIVNTKPFVAPKTVVVDVTSVKIHPRYVF